MVRFNTDNRVVETYTAAGWVAFDKEQVQFQAVDNDKRLVLGPILVPDKRILRIDGEGKPYHVFLSAPTIKKLSEKYLQNKYTDKVTVEHEKAISDVSLVESWIVESRTKDKSAVYGLSLAPGTWAGTMKVNNEKLWQDFVKTGKLTGFSIEGLFSHQLVAASKENYLLKDIEDLTEDEAELVVSKIKSLFEAQPTTDGSTYAGEPAKEKKKVKGGDIPPILQDFATCPESTQNIKLNIANRQKAIDEAKYGPLNPNEPNEDYWKAKADQFGAGVEEAKKALCGNCSFFYRTPEILKCIAEGLGEEVDPYEAIDAGEIGYCEAYDFKCASSRTCDAWVVGGPITE
jgi:hypothetical protein